MPGPLEGIKVVECNRVAPGSLATVLLADMGADVVRVVEPGPPDADVGDGGDGGSGGPQEAEKRRRRAGFWVDRNKRSLSLDLKKPEAQEALRRLAAQADVLVEGFRPGVMQRLGADYDTLSALNPRLVYCSLSGFGQDGPYRDFPAHDINYLSLAGVLNQLGQPGEAPTIPLNLVADYAGASMHGALGVMFALFARERTGRGQLVDVSYLDATISLLCAVPSFMAFLGGGPEPRRGVGTFDGSRPYYTTYECADGKLLSIGSTEPHLWHNFCDAVDRPDWRAAELTRGEAMRGPRPEQAAVKLEVAALLRTKPRDEWYDLLTKADVCVGKVYDPHEVFEDPQVRHRGMALELDVDGAAAMNPGVAIKLSQTPGSVRFPTPRAGAHTDEILGSLGYSGDDIASLRAAGAI
ncbi:MAG: CoA transferase [Acidimicrobiia bacterium]|nr:CoA transferase [Acidimicrobiia bacterium]